MITNVDSDKAQSHRLQSSRQRGRLRGPGTPIQSIAFDLGYSSGSAFIAMFARQAGCTPEQYRRSHLEGRKV